MQSTVIVGKHGKSSVRLLRSQRRTKRGTPAFGYSQKISIGTGKGAGTGSKGRKEFGKDGLNSSAEIEFACMSRSDRGKRNARKD